MNKTLCRSQPSTCTSAGQPSPTAHTLPSSSTSVAGLRKTRSRMVGFQSVRPTATAASTLDLTGRWQKDRGASDMKSYERQLDMLQLGGIQKKTAVMLLTGVDIRQDDEGLTQTFLVPRVSFFKQSETYKWNEDTCMQRRDRKGGEQVARLQQTEEGIQVDISWSEPNAGGVKETFTMPKPGVLEIRSATCVGDKCIETVQVYKKQG